VLVDTTRCVGCHACEAACASACPVKALEKQPTGPITYDASKCMGCRYCMVACPFDVPRYEYEALAPRVRKCTFCAPRQAKGLPPACAEVCPSGALTFGKRHELMEEAKRRIYGQPGRYLHKVYGEREAGGTSFIYISDVPFEKFGLPAGVPEKAYPALVAGALGAPPLVMTLWPPLLMGLYAFSKRREETAAEDAGAQSHDKEDHHG